MTTVTPPPIPQHFESADYFQLAVFIIAWATWFAYAGFFIRLCVLRGDLLTRYEKYVDQHDDVETFAADCIPTAQQVARTERALPSLREKLEAARERR